VAALEPPAEPTDPDGLVPRAGSDAELAAELAEELADELAEGDRPARPKRWWVLPLRLAVSVAMLWFLVHKIAAVSFADLVPEWSSSALGWTAAALALSVLGVALSAARWHQVLVAMGAPPVRFARLLSHYFAGQFVSNVLPTTIGGDVLRVSRLAADTGEPATSFASVIIERLTGWLVLPILTATGFLLAPEVRHLGRPTTLALAIAGGTLVALVAILFAADHPRLGGRFATRQGWRRFIGSVHLGVNRMRRHPRAAAAVVLVGVAYQAVLVLAAAAGAQALGISGAGFTVLLAVFPAVLIAQVLPIGISGLGVREGALVIFLSPLGVPEHQAVALGIFVFAMNLIVSLLGAPAFAAGSRRARARARTSVSAP
jgi:uncharacterized membrane protein YbhN (UPF0104 family)